MWGVMTDGPHTLNKTRLAALVDFLETVPVESFSLTRWVSEGGPVYQRTTNVSRQCDPNWFLWFAIAQEFFGLTKGQTCWLFHDDYYTDKASPIEVAWRIRALLRNDFTAMDIQ